MAFEQVPLVRIVGYKKMPKSELDYTVYLKKIENGAEIQTDVSSDFGGIRNMAVLNSVIHCILPWLNNSLLVYSSFDFNEHSQDLNPGYLDLNLTALPLSYLPLLEWTMFVKSYSEITCFYRNINTILEKLDTF